MLVGVVSPFQSVSLFDWRRRLPQLVAGVAFLALFWVPLSTLPLDWWQQADAGHGLLLAPLAVYLGWRRGLAPASRAQPVLGLAMLAVAVLFRYLAQLAAEPFTMRLAMLGGLFALVVYWLGTRQLMHWWLSASLLLLSIPLPAVVLGSLALPLQLEASKMGAALLEWRYVPVRLSGNVVQIPGHVLFVTEACSGLRSLASLLSLGLLVGALTLRSVVSRFVLVATALPVAILLNGFRVFLTGFLVYYVDPRSGEGFMHATEGWLIFVVAFAILMGAAWMLARLELRLGRAR